LFQVRAVHVGDLQLSSRGGLQLAGDVDHVVVVEVQPGHRVTASRLRRLLLQRDRAAIRVELDDAVRAGLGHVIGEHDRAVGVAVPGELGAQTGAVEDVVAENQRGGVVADVLRTDLERLCQPLRPRLLRVGDAQPELGPVPEKRLERRLIGRRGDHQDVGDPSQHQRGERVVDHRLVVDRHQLLADRDRQRVQPRPGATSENDSLHAAIPYRP